MAASELTPIIPGRAVGVSYDATNLGSANTVQFDSDTGFYIDVGDSSQVNDASKMILFIGYGDSADTAGGIKIKSSTQGVYSGSGIPDLAIDLTTEASTKAFDADTLGSAEVRISVIGPLETARFKDSDGYINVEYDTDHAGPVVNGFAWAIILP